MSQFISLNLELMLQFIVNLVVHFVISKRVLGLIGCHKVLELDEDGITAGC